MKCPKCKKQISSVLVASKCWQTATLNKGTNVIGEYGTVDDVGETVAIHCPVCVADITDSVKE